MDIWQIWIIVGIGLFAAEIFTPGFVLGVIGLGCFGAALAAWLEAGAAVQVVSLTVVSVIGFVFVRPVMLRYVSARSGEKTFGIQAMVGRQGVVREDIGPGGGTGRVKVGGEEWQAVSEDGGAIFRGATVEIRRVEGLSVVVTPTEDE